MEALRPAVADHDHRVARPVERGRFPLPLRPVAQLHGPPAETGGIRRLGATSASSSSRPCRCRTRAWPSRSTWARPRISTPRTSKRWAAAWRSGPWQRRTARTSWPAARSTNPCTDGNKIVVEFDYVDGGLAIRGGDTLKGFAIAGADKKFVWAEAKIVDNTLVASSPDVESPAAVRYAWANNPECNLINKAGLPASPFRTDDWSD